MASLTVYHAKKILDHAYGATTYTPVVTHYKAMIRAELWQASHAYSVGDMVVKTDFPTTTSKLFRCTTAGTSGGSEPAWSGVAVAGTITDGGAVFTEQTNALIAGTVYEPSTGVYTNYARASFTNNTSDYANATGTTIGSKATAAAINFGAATITSGTVGIVGVATFDASSAGNCLDFEMFASFQAVANGGIPSITSGASTLTLI